MNRRLNVVHIVRALQTGGLETLVLELCVQMGRDGEAATTVCAMLPGDGLEARPEYREVRVISLSPQDRRNAATTILALTKILRREHADAVHIHNFLSQVHGAPAAKLAGVPVVVTTKHGWIWPRVLGSRALAGKFWGLADALVTVSRQMRTGFVSAYGFPIERTRVILNGINTDRFRPAEGDRQEGRRRVLGLSGAPLLGTVCRLIGYKGVPTLLEAFRGVRERLPDAALVLAGDGPERRAYEQQAEGLGIARSVHFLGNRSDVAAIYPLLDIYVQASHREGVSLTMLEAASCALPIVATNVGGNPEIVVDGKTGRLVPPHDAMSFTQTVLQQWDSIEAARAMGCEARERIVRLFSVARMAREYLDLYREVYRRKVASRARAAGRT